MYPFGNDQGAIGDMGEAMMENAEADMLDATIGPNPMSAMLRAEAAVEEVEAVVDMIEGDW